MIDLERMPEHRLESNPSALIQGITALLRQQYIEPGSVDAISQNLWQHFEARTYDGIHEGEFLAYALTTHLQEVTQDQHLWVRWHNKPLPDYAGPLHQDPSWTAAQEAAARAGDHGFRKLEILAGNVGYLDIRSFPRLAWAQESAQAALDILAHCAAIILDLRDCQGGYADMVTYVCSHFFDAPPIHLFDIYWQDERRVEEFWTDPGVAGPRLAGLPLFLLTSQQTFSAGEQFVDALVTQQRATVIGETTGGGAHPGASFRLDPHFELFIPIGRSINPVTKQNWEGVGITPHVECDPHQALQVAHREALIAIS